MIPQDSIQNLTRVLFDVNVTFKLKVFYLWQTNFDSYEESTSSPV